MTSSLKKDLQSLYQQKLLAEYPELRPQAMVTFVMSVAQSVVHLNRALQYRWEFGSRLPQLDETIEHLTDSIYSIFQQCFGQELFEQRGVGDVNVQKELQDTVSETQPTQQAEETVEQLRRQRDVAINHLAEWCVAIDVNGGGWDDWDDYYKDVMWRKDQLPEIRELLVAAIAKAKASRAQR